MQPTTRPSPWAAFGKYVAVLFAVAVTAILRGLVLTVLWRWFVEPLGVPSINVAAAIGLAAIVAMLWQPGPNETKAERKPTVQVLTEAFFASVFMAALALGMGWVAHLFV